MSVLLQDTSFFIAIKIILQTLWAKPSQAKSRGLQTRVVISLILSLLTILLNLYIPLAFKHIVESLSDPYLHHAVFFVLTVYAVTLLSNKISWNLQEIILNKVIYEVAKTIQHNIFCHLHTLSLSFHLNKKAGTLATILSRIYSSVHRGITLILFYFLSVGIEIIACTLVLWQAYGWSYASIISLMVVTYVVVTVRMFKKYSQAQELANQAENSVGAKTIDSLINYYTVKVFNNEAFEAQQSVQQLDLRSALTTRRDNILLRTFLYYGIIMAFATVLATVLATSDTLAGKKTVADLILINGYLMQINIPLSWLGAVLGDIVESINNLRQALSLQQIKPNVVDKPQAASLLVHNPSITFDRVNFSYTPERPILHNVSFQVQRGQTVAIVGPTGAGKSTISQLLYRFYDINQGAIYIDNQNIADVTQESLRAIIGIVPQDTTLFNDTLYFNIHYGNLKAREQEVLQAAQTAGIHDFIMRLPQQYQTPVGERGLKLSGGERQRIAMARCLLKKAKIYIFDEATSALDTQTERYIHQNLKTISKGITTLIIAHRLSTIVDTDHIIVLDHGQIVEQGSHKHLLELGGKYAQLWYQQTRDFDNPAVLPLSA